VAFVQKAARQMLFESVQRLPYIISMSPVHPHVAYILVKRMLLEVHH
jgi:hypothetical protein